MKPEFPCKTNVGINSRVGGGAPRYLHCEGGEVGVRFVGHIQPGEVNHEAVTVGDRAGPPGLLARTEVCLGPEGWRTAGGGVTVRGGQGTLRAGQHTVLRA